MSHELQDHEMALMPNGVLNTVCISKHDIKVVLTTTPPIGSRIVGYLCAVTDKEEP